MTMNDDREIRLGNIQHLEVDDAPSTGSRRAAASDSRAAPDAPAVPRKQSPARSRDSSQWWMGATVFLLVIVLVLGVWFARQLSVLQAQMDVRISESSEQLSSLSSQLSATDESVTQSWDKVSETLKLHDSEIRKLWDVSNKRNKGLIDRNTAEVAALKKSQQEASKSLTALTKELEKVAQQHQSLVIARNQLQTQVSLGADTIKTLETRLASQQKTLQELDKLLPVLTSLGKLEAGQGGLAARLAEIESAIAAFDNYRRQTNVRLDRIEGTAAR